jgi:NADH dehydrogenase (ubiquinone) Fe-S protein 1
MVNARLRKAVRSNKTKVAVVGPEVDLTYPHQHLGASTDTLLEIAEGRHPFCAELASAERPVVIVGSGALERADKAAIMSALDIIAQQSSLIRDEWFGANVLLLNASQAAARDLGFVRGARAGKSEAKFVYLLGADDLTPADIPEDAFVVYQGHHGDRSAYRANVILPGAAYTEKEGTYENVEGRAQQTSPAVPTVGDARDDWKIIRTLSEVAGKTLPYDNANGLRARMLAEALNLLRVDEVELATGWSLDMNMRPTTALEYSALPKAIENYYMADVANLIKLVDTRDIVELELQQSGRADS